MMIMMSVYRLTIPGKPIPKARPRFAKGHTYTPKRTLDEEKRLRESFRFGEVIVEHDGPHGVNKEKRIGFPWLGKSRLRFWVTFVGASTSADLSNLVKSVEDAMMAPKGEAREGGIIWDDQSIDDLRVRRGVGGPPRIDLELEVLGADRLSAVR